MLSIQLEEFVRSAAYPDALLCLKRAHCDREQLYLDLEAECEERCCAGGLCRYPANHVDREKAGGLLPAYESRTFTEGGPCSPSTPSGAIPSALRMRSATASIVAAMITAAAVALL